MCQATHWSTLSSTPLRFWVPDQTSPCGSYESLFFWPTLSGLEKKQDTTGGSWTIVNLNTSQQHSLSVVLTRDHCHVNASVASLRVVAQVDGAEEAKFLRIAGLWQVLVEWDNPSRHGSLSQSLVHHVLAPVVVQEVGRDEQSPEVAALHCLAELRGHGTSRAVVPVLQEAAEASGWCLQESHQLQSLLAVAAHRAVAHKHVIVPTPTQQRAQGWLCFLWWGSPSWSRS